METSVEDYYHQILPFYEAELAGRGDEPFWTWAAKTPEGCRVLELGAGTGRATSFLARTAGSVVAFDLAPELIAHARHRLAHEPTVAFFAADMRRVELKSRFDLIAAVDDPFVHLTEEEDRQAAFDRVAAHLAPQGRFLLDAAWLPPRRRRKAEKPEGLESEHPRGRLEVQEVNHCEAGTRLCVTRFEYRLAGALAASATFKGRLWSLDELHRRAHAAGLCVTRLWGDYDRRPWDRESSPRLLAELRVREAGD